ncbi:MAG: aminopeptidase P family protein [bacterium]
MNKTTKFRRTVLLEIITVLVSLLLFCDASLGKVQGPDVETPNGSASVIRITPPAPVLNDRERLAELAQRRARVAQEIGSKSVLLLFSAQPRIYTNDVYYEYRQENNLYYLTMLKQKGATLVLVPGNAQVAEILFLPRRDSFMETWSGHMYTVAEAARASGIKEIWDERELSPFLQSLRAQQPYRPKAENILLTSFDNPFNPVVPDLLFQAAAKHEAQLYLLSPNDAGSAEYSQERRFASDWTSTSSGFAVKDAAPIFASMRLRKSPMEVQLLQHAIDITTEAQERAWSTTGTAKWEYEVEAEVAYTFKRRNADHWGYPSIVGCGPNATTLHYIESQGAVNHGDLILMDVGAEYEHYTADVTRTFPVSGKFSPPQAEIYQIVYDAQEAGARVIRPGAMYSDVHRAATAVIKDGLLKLGLITDRNSNQYQVWFMHGTSHLLGMNVHDVGLAVKLEPGMVFTNEPGIYVRPDALDAQPWGWKPDDWEKFKKAVRPAFEKYRGIGVRIEDDMLVTPDGVRWMTGALPRKMTDIETLISRARKESVSH